MYAINYLIGQALEAALSIGLVSLPVFLWGRFRRMSGLMQFYALSLGIYLVLLIQVTGLPDVLYHPFDPHIYLGAIYGMADDVRGSIQNVILFIPLGFLLVVMCPRYRKTVRVLCFSFWVTLTVELLQIFTWRLTDINDIITNTLGGVIGWWIAMQLIRPFPKLAVQKGKRGDIFAVFAIAFCVRFFLQPLISAAIG